LKRHHDIGDFVRFSVPNELNFPIIAEELEAVLIRERLPLFEELGDIADFVICQVSPFFELLKTRVRGLGAVS